MSNMSADERILGLTMVTDRESGITYAMSAQYDMASASDNPIITIVSNYRDKKHEYKIEIYGVNPYSATMMEMFALCCYADDKKISKNRENFGTFHILKQYMTNAVTNGICNKIAGYEKFYSAKLDWNEIVNFMKNEFLTAGVYNQYQECLYLMEMIDYFYSKHYLGNVMDNECEKNNNSSEYNIPEALLLQKKSVAKESYIIGKKAFSLEEWREFLEKYERIGDAIKALMKQEQSQNS